MRTKVVATGVALLVPVLGACEGGAGTGENQAVQLGEPEAVYTEPFSVVSTVREFDDGRVLVADALGQVVVRLDLDAGTADTIGKVGEGPDEYRQPDAVWPLPGGRTLTRRSRQRPPHRAGPRAGVRRNPPLRHGQPGPGESVHGAAAGGGRPRPALLPRHGRDGPRRGFHANPAPGPGDRGVGLAGHGQGAWLHTARDRKREQPESRNHRHPPFAG